MDSKQKNSPTSIPLAEKLRPQKLQDVVGQGHLTEKGQPLFTFLETYHLPSMIFWGEPGTGKTTLAKLLASQSGKKIIFYSAVTLSVTELKKVFSDIEKNRQTDNNPNSNSYCIFIDEIHRFNKSQQDSLLHPIESGLITLIGATTENPSFSLNNALLSRVQIFTLHRLETKELQILWQRGQSFLGKIFHPSIPPVAFQWIDGDARKLYNLMETLSNIPGIEKMQANELETILSKKTFSYDRSGEHHYNLISALHKSLRGSDVDASLYWLARMLKGGEDIHYLARRLLRFAYEDIGLADPQAAVQALSAWQTYERLGSPEGEIALVHTVIYLALSPKSNSSYKSYKEAMSAATKLPSQPPPKHILNAVTDFMKNIGYGQGYQYDHDQEHSFSGQNYFPETMDRLSLYQPKNLGFERELKKRLDYFNNLRKGINDLKKKT